VPDRLAEIITTAVDIPTIGIGAGPYCDGQGLVSEDMLGFYDRFCPKFVRQYRNLSKEITDAFCSFRDDVGSKRFPGPEHTTRADEKWIKEFQSQLGIDEGSDRNDIRKRIFASGANKSGSKTEKQVARRPSRP
jgi:3-methyl-2-oxobutanoate hydroxymethyltransferase